MPDCTVTFTSLDKTAGVASGTPLLEAAVEAGLSISSLCGGDGVCGRCKMIVKEGQTSSGDSQLLSPAEVEQGMVLGCLALVQGDLTVEIPAETSARDKIAVDQDAQRFSAVQPGVNAREFDSKPLVSKVFLDLDEPTLDDNLGDCPFQPSGTLCFFEVTKHHYAGKHHRHRVDLVQPGIFRGTTVGGFKDGYFITEVGTGSQP